MLPDTSSSTYSTYPQEKSYPQGPQKFVPLNAKEKERVKRELTQAIKEKVDPIVNAHMEKMAVLNGTMAEADRNIQQADRNIQQADRNIQIAEQGMRDTLVKVFYRIFYASKQPIPAEPFDSIYNAYLADGSISADEANRCFRLNSTQGILNYLKTHSQVNQCDLRPFKASIGDISALTNYLKASRTVKTVFANNGISQEAKNKLAEALAARKGDLKVLYSA
jgi:hypothetical protein